MLNLCKEITILLNDEEKERDYLSKTIRELRKESSKLMSATGVNNLYFGYPFVEGQTNENMYIRGPLFLIPIEIKENRKGKGGWNIIPKESESIFNTALIDAFSRYCNVNIDDNIYEYDINKKEIRKSIEDLFNKYEINYDSIEIKPEKFIDYCKDNKPAYAKVNCFKVVGCGILGIFPKYYSSLYKDFEKIIQLSEESKSIGLLKHILLKNSSAGNLLNEFDIDEISENNKYFLHDMDESQEAALLALEHYDGVVVNGPPGCGKSYLITNVITNAIAQGKKVLLVSEKKAALDVVYEKLLSSGFDDFSCFINNIEEDKASLFEKIKRNIELEWSYSDIEIESINAQIDEKICRLNNIIRLLNKPMEHGLTPYDTYINHSRENIVNANFLGSSLNYFNFNSMMEFLNNLRIIGNFASKYEQEGYILKQRRNFENISLAEQGDMLCYIDTIHREIEELKTKEGYNFFSKESSNIEEVIKILQKINIVYIRQFSLLARIKKLYYKLYYKSLIDKIKLSFDNIDDKDLYNKMIQFIDSYDNVKKEVDKLSYYFNSEFIDKIKTLILCGENDNVLEKVSNFIEKDFDELQQYDLRVKNLKEYEQEVVKRFIENKKIKLEGGMSWKHTFENGLYSLWIKEMERSYKELREFKRQNLNDYTSEMQRLIKDKKDKMPQYIYSKLMEKFKKSKAGYDTHLLQEFSRKRNRISLRKLVEEFLDKGLLEAMPVWLATSDTVSSIFPLTEGLFDIVIFDEASQVTLENSIPVLYRAKKVMIAGDENQMPPTNFFNENFNTESLEDEEDHELLRIMENESLLEAVKLFFPNQSLIWHYRSIYEELINFSNHAFYGGNIKAYPNPFKFYETRPIEWIYCENGVWGNNVNEMEAIKVIEILNNIMQEYHDKSIGIIAFNKKHSELIEKKLNKLREADAEFNRLVEVYEQIHKTEILISNLENCQGSERDIIILSIAYASNSEGRLNANFGPLSEFGGEKRLNVAISRAKFKMYVVSSFRHTDLAGKSFSNEGPKLLKEFIAYAEAVSSGKLDVIRTIFDRINNNKKRKDTSGDFDSPFEKEVYSRLVEKNYIVDRQVGCSGYRIDLGIVHPDDPDRYILGVECDGAMYHSSKSAKERDIYRQRNLEEKGWIIERIWSRDWWNDREKEIRRIVNAIESLRVNENNS